MSYIPDRLKEETRFRANNRCEYCHLSQVGQEATFHVDHIIPRNENGETILENLALACVSCSLFKSAKFSLTDPLTQQPVFLFNPRKDIWEEHFSWDGVVLFGKTATGRATIEALKMNRPLILAIRREESLLGRHPI